MALLILFLSFILPSLIFWWIIKKQRRKILLPILQIIHLPENPWKKIQLKPPEWIPFLCFFLLSCLLLFLLLEPYKVKENFTRDEPIRTHVFVDLSPSISAFQSIDEYRKTIKNILIFLQKNHQVSISTTHSQALSSIKKREDIDFFIKGLTYQRAGSKLGMSLQNQLAFLESKEKLIIISDADKHSWDGFSWQYFSKDLKVRIFDIKKQEKNKINFFVQELKNIISPISATYDWDLTVSLNKKTRKNLNGTLDVFYQEKKLASENWQIKAGDSSTVVAMSLARYEFDHNQQEKKENFLKWEIKPQQEDSIELDNTFRSYIETQTRGVLLISPSQGEEILDDPAYILSMSLESLAYHFERIESLPQDDTFTAYPLWIYFVADNIKAEQCAEQVKKISRLKKNSPKALWLAPHSLTAAAYENICQCFSSFIKKGDASVFCQNIKTPSGLSLIFEKLAATQIGGDIYKSKEAFAWQIKEEETKLEVVAFVVPLSPHLSTGVTHARFPLLMKTFLQRNSFFSARDEQSLSKWQWPRPHDYLSYIEKKKLLGEKQEANKQENIPLGESVLAFIEESKKPQAFKFDLKSKEDEEIPNSALTPIPYLKFFSYLILLLTLLETLWIFRNFQLKKRKVQLS